MKDSSFQLAAYRKHTAGVFAAGLWQPLLLSLLHYIVDIIYRCSISNLLCCIDAGRGIQGRSGSQRWQDAQLQLGYHCRFGEPGVAEGPGLEGWQAGTPASGMYTIAFRYS